MPIDCHVHVVGNGRRGSGCWLRIGGTWWQKPLTAFMLRHIGLTDTALDAGDFDERFVAHLLRLVRESSIGTACIFAQDEVYSADGRKRPDLGTFYVPNDYVLRLAREHAEFLPVVSIHPARPDALDELDRCLAAGAVMLKLLPNCHDVNCNDARYRPFWERMAAARLPLLAHTGGEHTVQVVNPAYADPRTMTLPLECGVTVIAAHAATKSGLGDPEYFHVWAEMLERWPNLHGDTSAWNVPMRGRHAGIATRGLIAERLMHGSDFPVPVNGAWARLRRFISDTDWQRCRMIGNVIERDYQLKRAMGFGPEHFTRVAGLLRTKTPSHSRP
ncbi:MAG: amidohydrolase family protein [Chthoniobacteraceae bacterium]